MMTLRWGIALVAAVAAFSIGLAAKGFAYKGIGPTELQTWTVATILATIAGTITAPPGHGRKARQLFIGMAVVASVLLLLTSILHQTFDRSAVAPVIGSIIGGLIAWFLIRLP